MEKVNKTEKVINYQFDDLSGVDTKILKSKLNGYNNYHNLPMQESIEGKDKSAVIIIRIEGELLKRKEIVISNDLDLREENFLQ